VQFPKSVDMEDESMLWYIREEEGKAFVA